MEFRFPDSLALDGRLDEDYDEEDCGGGGDDNDDQEEEEELESSIL
jgi:hypothetical protein